MSNAEFQDSLNALEKYINQLRPLRKTHDGLDRAIGLINTMRFDGMFNQRYRDEFIGPIEELMDDIYLELNRSGE